MAGRAHLHLVLPHQLFEEQLGAPQGARFVLIEHDLMFRQIIGWRECLRATYHLCGRRLRTGNHLGHGPDLGRGWWQASTGLDPLDLPAAVGRQGRRRPSPPAGAGRAAAELMRTELLSF